MYFKFLKYCIRQESYKQSLRTLSDFIFLPQEPDWKHELSHLKAMQQKFL